MTISPYTASVLTVILTYIFASHGLDYSDLEALGVVCPPRDTCDVPFNRTFSDMNCACDQQCGVYNDCCINASPYFRGSSTRKRGLICLPDPSREQGVYAIGRCNRNWSGPSLVRQKCESGNDVSDPMIAAPVTDIQDDITYKNRYCSECNFARPANLRSWIIRVECDSLLAINTSGNITEEYVQEHITYKRTYPHRNKWGVFLNNGQGQQTFYPCRMSFKLPGYLEENVRLCRPGVISTCSPTWRRNRIRRNCGSYMAIVYTETQTYRNPHCALCNNVDLASLTCPIAVFSRRKPPLSFTLLLDVNLNDGNRVGAIDPCPEGQRYDSFFKKCRTLVCALPGYHMEGETCVRTN